MYELLSKTFWLLVLILLPHWCKIPRPYIVPVSNYEVEPKAALKKKEDFSGQILVKLRL